MRPGNERRRYIYHDVSYWLEEQQVLISGGLLPGERICISPIQAVVDGMAVLPVVEMI